MSILKTANVHFDATGSVRIGKDGSAIVITGGPLVFNEMNVSYGQANTARDGANTAGTIANASYGQANTARDTANTADTVADAAYGQANTARNTANTADTVADAAYGQANAASASASTADTKAVAAYGQANTARTHANSAYGQANAAISNASTADAKAVAAFAAANNVNNLSKADGNFIVGTGSAWTVESGATARASMGAAALAVGQAFTGGTHSFHAQTSVAIETLTGSQTQGLEIFQSTSGADAIISFHISGDYATYFGVDGGDNDFVVGGWSMGTTKYRVLHMGNYQGLIAGTNGYGTRTVSTSDPSGGNNGDIWLKV